MFIDALQLALSPFLWSFEWMGRILTTANALPAFLAIFAASVVSRLIIRPLVGDQVAVRAEERRTALKKSRAKAKANNASSKKGD